MEEKGYFDTADSGCLSDFSQWTDAPAFGTPELPVEARKRIYREWNKKIRRHTLKTKRRFIKETEELFVGMGNAPLLSRLSARLFYTETFQNIFVESGIAFRLKKLLGGK